MSTSEGDSHRKNVLLGQTNYSTWRPRQAAQLHYKGLWEVIENGIQLARLTDSAAAAVLGQDCSC